MSAPTPRPEQEDEAGLIHYDEDFVDRAACGTTEGSGGEPLCLTGTPEFVSCAACREQLELMAAADAGDVMVQQCQSCTRWWRATEAERCLDAACEPVCLVCDPAGPACRRS